MPLKLPSQISAVILLMVSCSAEIWAAPSGEKEKCTHLKVTAHPNDPPYAWRNGDQIMGLNIQLARKVAKTLNINITTHYTGHWNRVLSRVAAGEFDMIAGLYKSDQRLKVYDFTESYSASNISVVSLKKSNIIYSGDLDQLKHYVGATVMGDSHGEKLDSEIARSLTLRQPISLAGIMNLFAHKRIDYAIHGRKPMQNAIRELGYEDIIKIHPETLSSSLVFMAFSKKSKCRYMAQKFSAVFQQMKQTNEIDALYEGNWNKWIAQANDNKH